MDKVILDNVAVMAGLAYTPQQIGVALQINEEQINDYMIDEDCEFYKTYWAAWYENDLRLRFAINKLAIDGSSPAQTLMLKIVAQNKISMNL